MLPESTRRLGLAAAAAVALAAALPVASLAAVLSAPAFTPGGAVLLSSSSVQSVVAIPGGYRMYLSSGGFRVLSATSSNQSSWSLEPGVRLSTSVGGLDASSITAVGVIRSTDPAAGWRMYYVGVDAGGLYSVLSATSTDGLKWGKESGVRLKNNGGLGAVSWLAPFQASTSLLRLYYVADQAGTDLPANFRVFSATAVDGGVAFSTEGVTLPNDVAYAVAATTLTGGVTRLYFTNPLSGSTTASQVLSARASDGLSFTDESGVRLSTDASVSGFGGLAVVRSTESFRWRMFTDYSVGGTTRTFVSSALTLTPLVDSFSPPSAQKGQASVSYSLTGEVFSPAPQLSFVLLPATYTATTVVPGGDTSLSGVFSTVNQAVGRYAVVVTNADGMSGRRDNALEITLPPGAVSILDNLFRPLRGGSAKITVTIFDPGNVLLRLYTVSGRLVRTLFDGPMPAGASLVTWDGHTPGGSVVASGVYLLHARGPNLDTVQRIVVIK